MIVGARLAMPLSFGAALVAVGAALAAAVSRRPQLRFVVIVALATVAASALSAHAVAGLDEVEVGPATGWVTLRTDPAPYGPGTAAVGVLEGRHYLVTAYGGRSRRLQAFLAGERMLVAVDRDEFAPSQLDRWNDRHVVGVLRLTTVLDHDPGSAANRAGNRVRRLLAAGAADMPALEQSLFLGLVIGDDRAQSKELVDAMRAAGLSHLTAVSGQNVAYVLVLLGPLLRGLRPSIRWLVTVALVAWFASITRWEPSVLRASAMAVLAATAFWRGRQASSLRLMCLAGTALVLLDPFLVRSVGWWMSLGATAGLALLSGPIERRLPGPPWFTGPFAASLAAHVGVAPVTALVFGSAPLLAPLTNLLAVPVAGAVMVWGIPAGLLAGALPWSATEIHLPSFVATRWIIAVARIGDRVEPGWPAGVTLALQLAVAMVWFAWRSPSAARSAR